MIRINALGGLSVCGDDGKPLTGAAAQPRRMAILALLARAGSRGVTREKLLSLIWPDADDERGPRTLAQALYALRKDLGTEEAISGAKELRLDPALVSSDVGEFAAAISRGDDAQAVALYNGPFLDGFHLPGGDELDRWVDRERATIAAEHARALESLARNARATNDHPASIGWWRKLAALEPLNARVAVALMDALAAAGDRAGAIQHARVYEMLVEQQLDIPADTEVIAFAERLRQTADQPSAPVVAAAAPNVAVAQPVAAVAVVEAPVAPARTVPAVATVAAAPTLPPAPVPAPPARKRWGGRTVALVGVAAVALVALAVRSLTKSTAASGDEPVVAIGNIAAFGDDSARATLTAPVSDLLTTSLARVRAIHVVSHGRMLELMRASGALRDTSGGGFVNAAKQAGATEIIDGTLYTLPAGAMRLDLRRVDLSTGKIGDVHTVEGSNLFALVDSGVARVVASLGLPAPDGSVADVTTRSVTAYRMYDQGIRAFYRGEIGSALNFFDAALGEDSLFAMAAYYAAQCETSAERYAARMERAKALSARATDRERLVILAGWANAASSPALGAYADTLATRYPAEASGQLYTGMARVLDGDFIGAIVPLQRAIVMDSLGLRGERPRCSACDALLWIVGAYIAADSMDAAEREARRALRLLPTSEFAVLNLVNVLEIKGRMAEADSVYDASTARGRPFGRTAEHRAFHLIRMGDYAEADRVALAWLRESNPREQADALWDLVISLREQGRYKDALDAARRIRPLLARPGMTPPGMMTFSVIEPQTLLEMGRPKEAAALFDSLARQRAPTDAPSQRARATVWMLTQSLGARFEAGDTATLARLVDSVKTLGEQSGFGRDRRLHHYVRGLLLSARGDDVGAIDELRASIFAPTTGFTRSNYQLARVYLHAKRPREAVAVLQPALRGMLDASNLYVNRIEVHELLARAWDDAGVRDSAAAHYAVVAKAWANADSSLAARREVARARSASR